MDNDGPGCVGWGIVLALLIALVTVFGYSCVSRSNNFQTIKVRGYITTPDGARHEASWLSYRGWRGCVRWRDMDGNWYTSFGNVTVEGEDSSYSGESSE